MQACVCRMVSIAAVGLNEIVRLVGVRLGSCLFWVWLGALVEAVFVSVVAAHIVLMLRLSGMPVIQ